MNRPCSFPPRRAGQVHDSDRQRRELQPRGKRRRCGAGESRCRGGEGNSMRLAAETAIVVARFLVEGLRLHAQRRRPGGFRRAELHLLLSTSWAPAPAAHYPPRFGGMLWYTNGDMRRWGSQYWWANTAAYYSNLMPANRLGTDGTDVLDVHRHARCLRAGGQTAMGLAGHLDSGDHVLQRPGEIARRHRQRAARLVSRRESPTKSARRDFNGGPKPRTVTTPAGIFWATAISITAITWCRPKAPAFSATARTFLCDAAKIGNLFYQRYLFTGDRRMAARSDLPDRQRRGGVLSQFSELAERRRRKISHPVT